MARKGGDIGGNEVERGEIFNLEDWWIQEEELVEEEK